MSSVRKKFTLSKAVVDIWNDDDCLSWFNFFIIGKCSLRSDNSRTEKLVWEPTPNFKRNQNCGQVCESKKCMIWPLLIMWSRDFRSNPYNSIWVCNPDMNLLIGSLTNTCTVSNGKSWVPKISWENLSGLVNVKFSRLFVPHFWIKRKHVLVWWSTTVSTVLLKKLL